MSAGVQNTYEWMVNSLKPKCVCPKEDRHSDGEDDGSAGDHDDEVGIYLFSTSS